MKKFRDTLGDIFRWIILFVMVILVICSIGEFCSNNWEMGFLYLAWAIGCLFIEWLISTLSKIVISLKEISDNSSAMRSLYESKMNESAGILPIPEPTSTENKE